MQQSNWDQLNGEVGWRAVLEQSGTLIGGTARLLLQLTQNLSAENGGSSKVVYSRVVAESADSGAKAIGELRRKWIIVDAVATFLNAGGTPEECRELVALDTERPIDVSPAYFIDICVNSATGERFYDFAYTVEMGETRYARWAEHSGIDYGLSDIDLDADDDVLSWVLSRQVVADVMTDYDKAVEALYAGAPYTTRIAAADAEDNTRKAQNISQGNAML